MDLSNARGEDEKIIALLQSIEAKSGLAEVTLPPDLAVTANVEFPETMPVTGTVAISGTVPVSIAGVDGGSGSLPVDVQGTVPISAAANLPVAVQGTVPISAAANLPVAVQGTVPVAVQGTVPVSGTVAISGTVTTNGAIQIASVQHFNLALTAGATYTALPSVAGRGYVIIHSWNAILLRVTRNAGSSFNYIFDSLPYTEPFTTNANEISLRRDDSGATITVNLTVVSFA